jgi:hypothetical protein
MRALVGIICAFERQSGVRRVLKEEKVSYTVLQLGLWSRYTKAPTPTPPFLKLRLRLLHRSSVCVNNGKPVRHFIATT